MENDNNKELFILGKQTYWDALFFYQKKPKPTLLNGKQPTNTSNNAPSKLITSNKKKLKT